MKYYVCVSARQIKAHVVFAPSVVALAHVSFVKELMDSSMQIIHTYVNRLRGRMDDVRGMLF